MKLLIVDDHDINLKLLRAQLEDKGHAVVEAIDGVEALEILAGTEVEGVISDILMPRMDGYRLCMEVRRNPVLSRLPFILYTSTYNSPSDRKLAESLGADAYLPKPAPVEIILGALKAAENRGRGPESTALDHQQTAPVMKQYNEVLVRKLEEKGLELEKTHQGLLASEARLSGLIASAMDAIIVADDLYKVVLFNAAAGTMFGCDPHSAIGRPLGDFIPMHSDDASYLPLTAFARGAGHGRTMGRQVLALRSDGTEFPIEASISRLSTSQGDGFTLFIRDITERLKAQAALTESAAGLRRAQDLAQLSHAVVNAEGWIESRSDSFSRLLKLDAEALPGTLEEWMQLVHPEDRGRVTLLASEARRDAKRMDFEYRISSGGEWRHLKHIVEPFKEGENPAGLRTFNTIQDVTAQKEIEERVLRLNRVYAVLSGINSLIVRAKEREELFQECCRIVVETGGFSKAWIGLLDEVVAPVRIVGWAGADSAFFARLQERLIEFGPGGGGILDRVLSGKRPMVCNDIANDKRILERQALTASGSFALASLPLIVGEETIGVISIHSPYVGFFDDAEMHLLLKLSDDIAFALDHLINVDRINYLDRHDSLTGLSNRAAFAESAAFRFSAMDSPPRFAVVLFDIIRFRRVSETFGRPVGDELLRMVAARLHALGQLVARVGPDIFALLLPRPEKIPELGREMEELMGRIFGKPFLIEGSELRIGCRTGAAVSPDDGLNPETLLLNAEEALRRGKVSASPFVFYAPEMNAKAAQSFAFESKLRLAMEREEFVLHYQPKVRLADGRICGAEALIRWQTPEGDLILPGDFISVLEETGMIWGVGKWALEKAMADRGKWMEAGLEAICVAVNVSPLQLNQSDFVAQIATAVGTHGADALEIEITESVIMEDVGRKIAMLEELRKIGVSVSVDDFGTGYSSLSYIAKLPITSLKIDGAFVTAMSEGSRGSVMVSSIIALAHALGLKVVAEGVETREQARMLGLLACDQAQGYLYSRPVPAETFAELLANPAAACLG